MHRHPHARTPQGCAPTFRFAPRGFGSDPPEAADSAHCPGSNGDDALTGTDNDDDDDNGPGGAPTMEIQQLRHAPGFRGGYGDTSPQQTRISPWKLTLRKSVKKDVTTNPVLELQRRSAHAIHASVQHSHRREAWYAEAGWKPRGGDPPGTPPDNRGYEPQTVVHVQPTTQSVVEGAPTSSVAEAHSAPVGETTLLPNKEAPNTTSGQDSLMVQKEQAGIEGTELCIDSIKSIEEVVAVLPQWNGTTICMVKTENKPESARSAAFGWNNAHVVVGGSGVLNMIPSRRVFDRGKWWKNKQSTTNRTYSTMEENMKKNKEVSHKWEHLVNVNPIWMRQADNVTPGKYVAIDEYVSTDWEEHAAVKLLFMEGQLGFSAILFFPKRALFDMFKGDIKKNLVKKCITMFNDLTENKDVYKTFDESFAKNLKLGICKNSTTRTKNSKLLWYGLTKSSNKMMSSDDYASRMNYKQPGIHSITGEPRKNIETSPFIEKLKTKGYNVLYMVNPINKYAVQQLKEYKGKKLLSATKEGCDMAEDGKDMEDLPLLSDGDGNKESAMEQVDEEGKRFYVPVVRREALVTARTSMAMCSEPTKDIPRGTHGWRGVSRRK